MEKFGQWINEFANTKAGIIIASAFSALLLLIYVFSKTSIGRKALNELSLKATTTKSYAEVTRENVEKRLNEEKETNDKKLADALLMLEEERKEMFEVLKLVPNAKVKNFVKKHESMSVNDLLTKYKKDALKGE